MEKTILEFEDEKQVKMFYLNLRMEMKNKKMTPTKLSKVCGINTVSFLTQLRTETAYMSLGRLIVLAKALDVPLYALLKKT